MKKIDNGVYLHRKNGYDFLCTKDSNGNYAIKIKVDNKWNRFGLGVSLDSCKRRINDYLEYLESIK